MPSKSKNQQQFFGMVRALQKGELSPDEVSPEVRKAAKTMKKKDVKDFASTKHKGLPTKVDEALSIPIWTYDNLLKTLSHQKDPQKARKQIKKLIIALNNFYKQNDIPVTVREIVDNLREGYRKYRNYYKNDPRMITAKKDGVCAETGRRIKAGESCVWYPSSKKIYAMDSKQAGEFRGYMQDLDMGYDY